jgi:S1-C subfamily serine protease
LDLLSDQVVEVTQVAPRSPAYRAGLQAGDFIVAINDRLVTNVDDIHRILSHSADLPSLELTVVRAERKLQVPIEW